MPDLGGPQAKGVPALLVWAAVPSGLGAVRAVAGILAGRPPAADIVASLRVLCGLAPGDTEPTGGP